VGTAQTLLLVIAKRSTAHARLATLVNNATLILMNVIYLKIVTLAKMVDFAMMLLMPMFASVSVAFMVNSVSLYRTCAI
jgi:hypothetical protein